MQIKVVLSDKNSKPPCIFFKTDKQPDEVLVSTLQEYCASQLKVPVQSVKLVHWKGHSICVGSRIKFHTLADADLQHLDRVTLSRVAALAPPIEPTEQNLCGPPIRLQRRSVQLGEGGKTQVCMEERFYAKPAIDWVPQTIYRSPATKVPPMVEMRWNVTQANQNSLYNCVSQLLFLGQQSVSSVRWLCASALGKRPDVFTPEVLRTASVHEYGKKVLNPSSWGGFIELSCIALEYNIGFAAWHTRNHKLDVYGEDFERSRGRFYLIYDGIHYDWVSAWDPVAKKEFRLFAADDDFIMDQVKRLALPPPLPSPHRTQAPSPTHLAASKAQGLPVPKVPIVRNPSSMPSMAPPSSNRLKPPQRASLGPCAKPSSSLAKPSPLVGKPTPLVSKPAATNPTTERHAPTASPSRSATKRLVPGPLVASGK